MYTMTVAGRRKISEEEVKRSGGGGGRRRCWWWEECRMVLWYDTLLMIYEKRLQRLLVETMLPVFVRGRGRGGGRRRRRRWWLWYRWVWCCWRDITVIWMNITHDDVWWIERETDVVYACRQAGRQTYALNRHEKIIMNIYIVEIHIELLG
jgi:hypothetical protein